MSKPLSRDPRNKTQTGLSAFFCVDPPRVARRAFRLIAGVLLALLTSAQARAFEDNKPAVHLKGVSIKSVDWSKRTADAQLQIAIDNPGPAFKLKDLSYRLKLNEKQAAEGKYDKEIDIPAHSSAMFELPCGVDLSVLPGLAWAVIAGGFELHYELATEFTVPIFGPLSPRIKTSIAGDLSLAETVTGWTAKIKERIASK